MITPTTYTILALLLLLPASLALLGQVPGLYLHKITLWSQNGVVHGPTTGGYNFTFAWRYTLPGIQSAGLGLYNFKTGPNKMLSYRAQLTNTTTSSTQVSLSQNIPDAGLTYLAFSVMVVTQDNNYVELLTFMRNTSLIGSYYLNSSKFVFGSSSTTSSYNPHMVRMFQWVYASDVSSTSYRNYWAHLNLYVTASTNQLRIYLSGYRFQNGGRVNIMLVARTITNTSTSYYLYTAQTGGAWSKVFTSNFGVPTTDYGQPVGGNNCLMGLWYISPYFYRYTSSTGSSSFLFTFSGASVTDITYVYVHGVRLSVACFGYTCPQRTFVDINNLCQSCHYDCLTCSNSTHCLSCSSSVDFREFNSSTFRCDPIAGYYESNTSVSGQCPSGCLTCLNLTYCLTCTNRTYYLVSSLSCPSCRFDCLTCSNSTHCLSCSSSVDFREFNSSTFRCDPIAGYYESNTSVSGQCPSTCQNCSNVSHCFSCKTGFQLTVLNSQGSCSCPSRFYLSSTSDVCLRCHYSCYSCSTSSSSRCLTCSSSVDFRQPNSQGTRCQPLPGYYQSYAQVSNKCSTGCVSCTTNTYCLLCGNDYETIENLGFSQCKLKEQGISSLIAIIVGGTVGVVVVIIIICLCRKYRRHQQEIIDAERRRGRGHQSQKVIKIDEPAYHASWDHQNHLNMGNQQCSICLDSGVNIQTNCGHYFHMHCLVLWTRKVNNCPNCRHQIKTKQHRIVCQVCTSRQRRAGFDEISRKIGNNNQILVVCPDCRQIGDIGR